MSTMTAPQSTGTVTAPLTAARAEALYMSTLPTGVAPSRSEVTSAIRTALRSHGGVKGCAADVAGEYGEYPTTAARRMTWALGVVDAVYGVH
ncbi:hypothetical protein EV385_4283 [Krasilnikovia cinnamomea]|uniref:Uncharacterized protein n=1 Tax=Krasilnikovia cinnamomea TaxID=349313 RepID=A0A4Q7ZN19_9ACTN|nr:hypothetical protein [Krasilnikovia cinnamomea]RZU52420.1 hypothetical protein EV385_4283 [Krasilnikovia cinnamomea]